MLESLLGTIRAQSNESGPKFDITLSRDVTELECLYLAAGNTAAKLEKFLGILIVPNNEL